MAYEEGLKGITIYRDRSREAQVLTIARVEEVEGQADPVLRAYHPSGDLIHSKTNPGEPAGFTEALGIIIDAYPGKDNILSATGGGSGGQGGKGGGGGDATLADLKKQHKEALENGHHQKAVGLKNKIFELEHSG